MTSSLRRARWSLAYAALLLMLVAALLPPTTGAQGNARYFAETGHFLKGAFRVYWEANGGLAIFGFPITEEYVRQSDGRVVQFFERARFELAGSGPGSFVELGRLGIEVTGGRIFPSIPPWAAPPGSLYFQETNHSLTGLFRTTWETRGGLRRFGYPISEEIYERSEDGSFRLVQYFERARFELWPEGVRFGRLGALLAPPQLLAPWPPNIQSPTPLREDGTPRPPQFPASGILRATVLVNPAAGRPGQSFQIGAAGFQPGEQILLWLTTPQGVVLPVNQVPVANEFGGFPFEANIGFDTGRRDPEGLWYVTGQGLTTGRIGIGAFTLGSDFRPSPEQPSGRATIRVVPGSGGVGTVFTLEGEGFRARENVSVWLTAPNQTVRAVTESLRADDRGSISSAQLRFIVGLGSINGRWFATAQGRESNLQGIAEFQVGGGGGVPQPPGPGQPPPPGAGDVAFRLNIEIHGALGIRDASSSMTPLAAAPGGSFRFVQGGFNASERVSVWLTAPNGEVEGVDVANVQTDGRGTVTATFSPRNRVEGDWKLTAQGIDSRRLVIVPFKLTRDYVAPPGTPRPPSRNGAVNPQEGGRGVAFQLSGQGFRPNEPLDHWITSPDGIYFLVGRAFADNRGRIGVSQPLAVQFTERNPPGVYGYHYRGINSGVRVDLFLTYTGN